MKKILMLPLLKSMPSGHHQVADAICENIYANSSDMECKKIDILSEWSSFIEKGIVTSYLYWIRRFPMSYAWTYRQFAYRSKSERNHRGYEILFLKKVKDLLKKEQPDLIVCTHGFSSLFINQLKKSGECNVPTLNIYTDFFINDVWGCSHIDYHFVPNLKIKQELSTKYSIDRNRIFITGIPISSKFDVPMSQKQINSDEPFQILVAGGSVGLGNIAELLKKRRDQVDCRLTVLCGANKSLYGEINQMTGDFAVAYPYISSKVEMNQIYNEVDAILSKPGGVTVSEAIRKDLPIFISSALPGQEQINLQLLTEMGLVFVIPEGVDALEFVCKVLGDQEKMLTYKKAIAHYRSSLELADSKSLFETIEHMLERG